VFHPDGRIQSTPNKHYILIVHEKTADSKSEGVWDVLDSLSGTIEGPFVALCENMALCENLRID